MTVNDHRRVNELWKHRHTHDDDDFQEQITVVKKTFEEQIDQLRNGAKTPSITVAASNASTEEKAAAHFVSQGGAANDEAAIRSGIDKLKQTGSVGGNLVLAGDFDIVVDSSPVFDLAGGAGTVEVIGLGNSTKTTIGVDASSTGGVLFEAGNNGFHNIGFLGGGNNVEAIRVDSPSSDLRLINCQFSNFDPSSTAAVEIRFAQGVWIERCKFSNSANRDILINAGANGSHITNCRFIDTGGPPIRFRGGKVTVADCYSTGQLIDADGGGVSDELHIVRCTTQESGSGTGAPAINLDFSGSIIEKLSIVDNNIHNPLGVGIYVEGQDGFLVRGNLVEDAREHGIHFEDCSNGKTRDNHIIDPGQETADTYDGIHVAGDSDGVDLRGDRVDILTSGQARYGINISAATCDTCSYLDERVTGTPGTAAYNNSGTGTINTWPASGGAVGDNL